MERAMGKIEEFRPKDSEKITINLGFVDLGHIDLLVQEGFYSNRTDFIRAAIRNRSIAKTMRSSNP
jgi:Arc/MetJ-type ribon-helix-helix transcriptional regulator